VGHTIVGELPKTMKWNQVIALLQAPEVDPAAVASATMAAAERRLLSLRGDPSITYCFWMLTRLASAARGPDFHADVALLGLSVRPEDHVLSLLAKVSDRVREELVKFPESGPFGDFSALALRSTLTQTLGAQNLPLLGSSVEDLARVFHRHSSATQFGELATRFFGDFYTRTLRYYIDRAIPTSLGPDGGLGSLADAERFRFALDLHARESARIVDRFAAEWFVKHKGTHGGAISREDVQGFSAHALRKLRKELQVDAA